MRFEASRVVFWSLSCYEELELTTNPFTGRTLHRLLIQMQNISLRSSSMRRKQNFVLILVWFERSLHSAQVSGQSWPWPLKLMMSRGVERMWIRMGGYGRFRGEWVNSGFVVGITS